MHYCCDTLVDLSFFGQAELCGDDSLKIDNTKNPNQDICTLQIKDCCSTKKFVKKGENTLKQFAIELDTETIVFVTLIIGHQDIHKVAKKDIINKTIYSSPYITKDFQLLHEAFLI
jgi:hypothetical protein